MKPRIKKIPDTFLAHPTISMGAKGLYAYINTKDPLWKGNAHTIACESKNTPEEIEEYIQEIMTFGYMTIVVEPVEGGESLYNFSLIDNRAAGRRKETKENIQRIVAYWNSFGVVEHKKITPGMENQIERNLDIYTVEEIYKAIENYSNIYKSKLTWWDHKWTLEEFLKRQNGVSVFLYKTEVDYLDKFKADSPKAKILINEERQKREAMMRKADQKETKEIEKTKAEQAEEKEMIKEFWKTLSIEQKKEIDLAVEKRMEGKESLKINFPKAYDDFRAMAYLMETRTIKDSLQHNDTENGSNEGSNTKASSIEGVQGG